MVQVIFNYLFPFFYPLGLEEDKEYVFLASDSVNVCDNAKIKKREKSLKKEVFWSH
jgi:hypothetical protein